MCIALYTLSSCKKTGSDSNVNIPPGLSYEFNGRRYDGSDGNWGLIFRGGYASAITINRNDLFGGTITFTTANCAWLDPGIGIQQRNECTLTNGDGSSIDSSVVYLYQSGTLSSRNTNCKDKQIVDYFTGEYETVRQCDINGSFDLILVNNKGNKIEIKNGTFKGTFQF